MRKIVLLTLIAFAAGMSCSKRKNVGKAPLEYTVENSRDTTPQDIYLPQTGHRYVALTVKFLGGTPDTVTMEVQGVPAGIVVTPQRSSGVPTYYYKYTYYTNNTPVGTYPVTIVATAPGTQPQRYTYNLIVIPNDCATLFTGMLTGGADCQASDYNYSAEASATGTSNQLSIANFGGYGVETHTTVNLLCEKDSLYVPSQNIGNGITVEGAGTFTSTMMTIHYTTVTPTGTDNCIVTLAK